MGGIVVWVWPVGRGLKNPAPRWRPRSQQGLEAGGGVSRGSGVEGGSPPETFLTALPHVYSGLCAGLPEWAGGSEAPITLGAPRPLSLSPRVSSNIRAPSWMARGMNKRPSHHVAFQGILLKV